MVLEHKQTTVAYRCPECGASVMSMVGIFALTADMIRLKCPCGGSEMEIVYTKDRKVRMNVPCFLCPTPHSYMISSSIFFDKDIFRLPCSYSGVDICFIGKQDQVQKAMEDADRELTEMLGGTSFEELTQNRGENLELNDPQIADIIMYVVRELADEGAIRCNCVNPENGDYEVEIHDTFIRVICKTCGAKKDISIQSTLQAQDFLEAEELILE